jgi:molecular chaperone HscB
MLDFSKNYFELFGLPTAFEVDTEALAEHYLELQRVVHPDRYANASERERRLAVQAAGHINEALEVLKEPLARARYLLSLFGVQVDAGSETTSDPMFLMEQMELREALAEARDQADPYGAVSAVMSRLRGQSDTLIAELTCQFSDPTPENLDAARENVRKMQFLAKLRQDAENLEAELDDELM